LVALCATLLACDPGTVVTIENRTSTAVDIFYESNTAGKKETTVAAMSTKRLTIAEVTWTGRVIARNSSGTIVYDEMVSWDDVKRTPRIVIGGP
jgi:hypothetical protein